MQSIRFNKNDSERLCHFLSGPYIDEVTSVSSDPPVIFIGLRKSLKTPFHMAITALVQVVRSAGKV